MSWGGGVVQSFKIGAGSYPAHEALLCRLQSLQYAFDQISGGAVSWH